MIFILRLLISRFSHSCSLNIHDMKTPVLNVSLFVIIWVFVAQGISAQESFRHKGVFLNRKASDGEISRILLLDRHRYEMHAYVKRVANGIHQEEDIGVSVLEEEKSKSGAPYFIARFEDYNIAVYPGLENGKLRADITYTRKKLTDFLKKQGRQTLYLEPDLSDVMEITFINHSDRVVDIYAENESLELEYRVTLSAKESKTEMTESNQNWMVWDKHNRLVLNRVEANGVNGQVVDIGINGQVLDRSFSTNPTTPIDRGLGMQVGGGSDAAWGKEVTLMLSNKYFNDVEVTVANGRGSEMVVFQLRKGDTQPVRALSGQRIFFRDARSQRVVNEYHVGVLAEQRYEIH